MAAIPLTSIYVPPRLRFETYGDLPELATSLEENGQLQSVLVRPPREDEEIGDKKWVLLDGGRRYAATMLLINRDLPIHGLEVGLIDVKIREGDDDELSVLLLEFEANEQREEFSWKEKAKFYTQAHEILTQRAEETESGEWYMKHTAQVLGTTQQTIHRYLELTEDEDLLESPEVSSSDTFRTAHKKVKIAKEKKRRKQQADLREKSHSSRGISQSDFYSMAAEIVHHADVREWLADLPDAHFAWFHWDPPYGGGQDGGRATTHEKIDDTPEYALPLIEETLPEIYRTLSPGGWLVIWFHQDHRESLVTQLRSLGFWVNPYECIWYKSNRVADGHEISRFLVNAYEPFFLCGKPREDGAPAILNKTSAQNVFPHDLPSKLERRHVMHKPAALLRSIIEIISVPGELGGDGGAGSGSIIEAALASGRRIEACEISEHYHLICLEEAALQLKVLGYEPPASPDDDPPSSLEI